MKGKWACDSQRCLSFPPLPSTHGWRSKSPCLRPPHECSRTEVKVKPRSSAQIATCPRSPAPSALRSLLVSITMNHPAASFSQLAWLPDRKHNLTPMFSSTFSTLRRLLGLGRFWTGSKSPCSLPFPFFFFLFLFLLLLVAAAVVVAVEVVVVVAVVAVGN